jgi:DNA-binding PucR family transcriptional regulator
MLADDRTLWTWIAGDLPHSGDLRALRQGVAAIGSGLRVALGAPGKGLAGFRGSLREAIRARAVAENAGVEGGDVVAFDDVAVAALLTSHSEDLKPWVDRVLGGLGEDGPVPRELRATLRVFLEEEGSFTRAAERLHVHKNTVHYRVRKAEGLRGRPVSEGRLNLEVALIAASLLRKRVSGPAAHPPGQ